MKVIIAGGRDFKGTIEDYEIIEYLHKIYKFTNILSGRCGMKKGQIGYSNGADGFGEVFAKHAYPEPIPVIPFYADWENLGKQAGPIRNEEMAKNADAIILFKGKDGTQSMRSLAKKYNLKFLYDQDRGGIMEGLSDREKSDFMTMAHIKNVLHKICIIQKKLEERGINHDKTKLENPEAHVFSVYTSKLKNSTYGSDEYKQFLQEMKPALDHHYEHNRHHPEHFENGVNGMNLVDIVEMFCDWLAATERHENGNIFKSIDLNQERFNMSPQLTEIFRNTARDIFGKEQA